MIQRLWKLEDCFALKTIFKDALGCRLLESVWLSQREILFKESGAVLVRVLQRNPGGDVYKEDL